MARYTLAGYTIRAKMGDQYTRLDNINISGKLVDTLSVFLNYFNNRSLSPSHDRSGRKLLKVTNFGRDGRQLYGIIETGEYGYESELYNVDTGNISYRRRIADAEMLPFYFTVYLPQNTNEGILLLQRFKQFGIKTMLEKDINRYLSRYLQLPLKFEIYPLVPRQLIEQCLNGRIVKLRFIRFSWPRDITDVYYMQDHYEEVGYIELVISAKKGRDIRGVKERIRAFLDGRIHLTDILEIRNFEYNNIKVEIDLNGNKRTVDLSNLYKFRAYYDITNEVVIGPNGHPTFDSINQVAQSILEDLKKLIYRDTYDR